MIEAASGKFLLRRAQALYAITADESWAHPITSVLATAAHWSNRIDAAIALAEFTPTPRPVRALTRAVRDHYLVSFHAGNTLLKHASHPVEIHCFVHHSVVEAKIREIWGGEEPTPRRPA